jgi:hypothetical protein
MCPIAVLAAINFGLICSLRALGVMDKMGFNIAFESIACRICGEGCGEL